MKKAILLIVILIISCSKDEIKLRPSESFKLSFNLSIPSETSKVSTCKEQTPTEINYLITNSKNESYLYTAPIEEVNNKFITTEEIELPIGSYTINEIDLVNNNESLYSIPTTEDGNILHYADLILPIDIYMDDNVNVSGTAFCYNAFDPPSTEGILDGSFETYELESLFFYVKNNVCIEQVIVVIDGYRIPEVIIFEQGTYEIAIPKEYTVLNVIGYNENTPITTFSFTNENRYNQEDLLLFDEDC